MKRLLVVSLTLSVSGATLFQENFDDANLSSRGWYDGPSGTITNAEHIPGSGASFECRFMQGATGCSGGKPARHKFTPSNSVYLSYWIKHSANWAGSGKPYHPHMFHFLSTLNDDYRGPAYSYLTTYTEEVQGYPVMALQDGQNIDETKIGADLVGVTENRSIAGCNGTAPNMGQYHVDCYLNGSAHWNGMMWRGPTAYFFDANEKVKWHFVEAYFQLNTVSTAGIGQQDGVVRHWYDGQLIIDHSNVILRTGQRPTMQFNQFLATPYIGDGSPVDQTFWIDNLTVATVRPPAALEGRPWAAGHSPLRVSPNPVRGRARIAFPNPGKRAALAVYDMAGKRSRVYNGIAGEELLLDAEGMAEGVYLLTIKSGQKAFAKILMVHR